MKDTTMPVLLPRSRRSRPAKALCLYALIACALVVSCAGQPDLQVMQGLRAADVPRHLVPPRATAAQAPPEDDWWLPDWVTASPHAGIYLSDVADHMPTPVPIQQISLLQTAWKDLEPRENQYNWSSIDSIIMANPDRYFWLRVYSSSERDVPTWLKNNHPGLQSRNWFYGSGLPKFYYIWDSNINAAFLSFLLAFKQHYVVENPQLLARIKFEYVPGAWNWNEYQVWPDDRKNPISAQNYVAWFNEQMNAYRDSLGGDGRKLVYTGTGHREWANDNIDWTSVINLPSGGNVNADYVVQAIGGGVRAGDTEIFNRYGSEPSWGQTTQIIGTNRYVITDDTHPLIAATDRYFGTENECYAQCGASNALDYYNVKQSFLLMLKLRMNWVFTSQEAYEAAPAMLDWSFKEMGKRADDAPDAWASLRQWTNTEDGELLNNWERWLYQRDIAPDGTTQPDNYISTAGGVGNDPYYEARRTDHADGSDYMYFALDDAWMYNPRDAVQIKVTVFDNDHATWWIEYDAADGDPYKKSVPVTNTGDGRWKTVTFQIADAAFQNRQRDGMDFRIFNGGANDIVVRFVRAIKVGSLVYLPLAQTPTS